MEKKNFFYYAIVPTLIIAVLVGVASPAQESPQTAEYRGDNIYFLGVDTAIHSDISPPLRDIPPILGGATKTDKDDPGPMTPCGPLDGIDPVAQISLPTGLGEEPRAMPSPNVSFDAWANLCSGCAPPDPNGDVGPNHVVVMANSTLAVYSKTGTQLLSPRNINTLWTGFGGNCETENAGDPVVLYDQLADRWLVSQFTADGPTYYNCVCLSTSGDPTGTWQRYAFSNGTSFPDYPKYGIWRDGYYFSTRNTSGSTGQGAYALNRDEMLAGDLSPTVVNFLLAPGSTPYYGGDGLLPADIDGDILPPAGAPQLYFGTMDNGGPYGAPQDAINVFQFHVDWATPANSTFTRSATVPVAAFDSTFTPCGGGRTCIPQPGTTNKIDTLSYRQRATFRAAYRNFGTHESVALNQSVSGYNSGTSSAIAGVRWYELRDPNGTPTIYQQGTYVPGATDGTHRWMGSIAMDRMGNMGLGFSASSGTVYPSIWYTGRLATDPLGTMPQGEGSIVNGLGSQTGGGSRWGDYTSLNIDPVDDCTFWHFNEYYTSSSSSTWQMRVGSFTFPNCLCALIPAAPTAGASAPQANRIALTWNDSATATITQYFIFRSTVAGGPYTQIATVADTSPGTGGGASYTYNDDTVSGGTRYYYTVKSNDGDRCTSPASGEVNALATGACLLPPTFGGVTSVTNPAGATCTLNLSWTGATSSCGNPVRYNVYRSTTPGFTPGAGNRIAQNLNTTSYSDLDNLVSGTSYYYIVRSVDTVNGFEDTNATEMTAQPTGTMADGTWTAGAETGDPSMTLNSPWTTSTTYKRTGTNSYSTGATYPTSVCTALTTPSLILGTGPVLTYYHIYSTESGYDGGRVEISTNGGSSWTPLTPTPAYGGTITSTGNSCSWATSTACYIGTSTGYPTTWQSASISLSAYNGQTVLLRWNFTTDSSGAGTGTNPGWYVDDISITHVQVPGSCATGSACANNPTVVDVTPNGPLTVCAGSGQLLTCGFTGGTGTTYQWYDGANPISGATSSTYTASDTGTHSYNCKVTGSGCVSGLSDASPTAITWQAAPAFGGLASVTNPQSATCTLDLAWSDATSACPGTITYKIYRSTTTPVSIIPGNLVTSGVTGTAYSDSGNLTSGTTYYYVVRAVDGASQEDANTTERSGAPTGVGGGPFTLLDENFEGTWGPTGSTPPTGWTIEDYGSVPGTWNNNDWHKYSHGGTYLNVARVYYSPVENQDDWLITPAFNLPAGATTAALEFDHYFYVYSTPDEFGYVDFMSDQTPSWTNLTTYIATTGTSSAFAHASLNLLAYSGQTNCKVRFRYVANDDWYWEMDNVKVSGVVNNPCTSGLPVPGETAPGSTSATSQGWSSPTVHTWPANAQATNGYRLYRGQKASLANLLTSSNDGCLRWSGSATNCTLSPEAPPAAAGDFYWYLVVGVNGTGEGSAGSATGGPRVINSTGTCP
jgi:hypothetical protein